MVLSLPSVSRPGHLTIITYLPGSLSLNRQTRLAVTKKFFLYHLLDLPLRVRLVDSRSGPKCTGMAANIPTSDQLHVFKKVRRPFSQYAPGPDWEQRLPNY